MFSGVLVSRVVIHLHGYCIENLYHLAYVHHAPTVNENEMRDLVSIYQGQPAGRASGGALHRQPQQDRRINKKKNHNADFLLLFHQLNRLVSVSYKLFL